MTTASARLLGGIISKRRNFSSSSDCDDKKVYFKPILPNNPPDAIKSHEVQFLNNLAMFNLSLVEPRHFLDTLNQDTKLFRPQFDLIHLKWLYFGLIKEILVANGLSIDERVADDTYLRDLSQKLCSVLGKPFIRCITSLDLMRTLVALPNLKWTFLLDHLRDCKVMVLEEWDLSIATIETMVYKKGWKVPLGDRTLYQGQTDAAYRNRLATLCSIIWKDDQIIDCCICRSIKCGSSLEAELLSMFLLERRAIDLGIKDLMVITDNDHVDKTVREEIKEKSDGRIKDLSMALLGLKSKYETFLCQLEPREQLLFPDSLVNLKAIKSGTISTGAFQEIIDRWSPLLLGQPLFRVHQTEAANKEFFAARKSGGKLTVHPLYKVKVENESSKVDAVRNVLMSMRPQSAFVLLNDEEKARSVHEVLVKLYRKDKVELIKSTDGKGYTVGMDIGEKNDEDEDRHLRIIFDSSIEDVLAPNTISIKLLLKQTEDDQSIKELSPECYLFFNGEPEERLGIGENIIHPSK